MPAASARAFFFIPPVNKPTGGVTVIWRMAHILRQAGREAFLVFRERGGWRPQAGEVPEADFETLDLTPEDVWMVPEGWGNALAPGLRAGARCLAYVQNWAYLFTGLPPGVDWRSLPVGLVAVSRPVAWFMKMSLGLEVPVLRPGIDLEAFSPPPGKPGPLRVGYMPRKNKALAEQIMAVIRSRGRFEAVFEPISGLDQAGVAALLGRSHAFLATGFPEGCPLPPLEAMACGAIPAGFAGLGGWDYMRQMDAPGDMPSGHEGQDQGLLTGPAPGHGPADGETGAAWPLARGAGRAGGPGAYLPDCPLEAVPWGGNGCFVPDNDVMGAALALERVLGLWTEGGQALERVLASCRDTAAAYGMAVQRRAVLDFWKRLG